MVMTDETNLCATDETMNLTVTQYLINKLLWNVCHTKVKIHKTMWIVGIFFQRQNLLHIMHTQLEDAFQLHL